VPHQAQVGNGSVKLSFQPSLQGRLLNTWLVAWMNWWKTQSAAHTLCMQADGKLCMRLTCCCVGCGNSCHPIQAACQVCLIKRRLAMKVFKGLRFEPSLQGRLLDGIQNL